MRERIRLYWSHCATYRVSRAKEMELPPVRTLDDIVKVGKEVVAKGYTALKTNVLLLGDKPTAHVPGFARGAGFPELNADRHVVRAIRDQLAAFREGTGPDMDLLVDLNFNYKTEGFLTMARAMEPFDLFWVEMDTRDAKALRYIRSHTKIPWLPASASSAGATTGPSSSSSRWTWPSWTRRGTAWRRGSRSPPWRRPTRSTWPRTTSTATWPP